MGEAIGTITVDLERVQVHPTGLVRPYDPAAQIKFLPSEALRELAICWSEANVGPEDVCWIDGGRPSLVSKLFVPPLVFFFSPAGSSHDAPGSHAIVADG